MLPSHPSPAVPSLLINLPPAMLRPVQQSQFLPKSEQGISTASREYDSLASTRLGVILNTGQAQVPPSGSSQVRAERTTDHLGFETFKSSALILCRRQGV